MTVSLDTVKAYLGETSWSDATIQAALDAETAAQAKVCAIPLLPNDPEWIYPADLTEALCRRVAHNLANRSLPLGLSTNSSDGYVSTSRVGGDDAEVMRLERPWRKRVVA